jgi:hypothetical protein
MAFPSIRWSAVFVWAVWGAMTASDLYWTTRHSHDLPILDDWVMVPILTGNQRLDWTWLWHQHNEHRYTVPWLVLFGIYDLGHNDFHTGVQLNPLLMSACAAAMIIATRRLRGSTSIVDAFFPLTLLHWGASENFLWTWQLVFYIPTTLFCAALLVMALQRERPVFSSALVLGGCLLLLPFSGAMGVGSVPALACWLAWAAYQTWQAGGKYAAAKSAVLVGLALAGFGLVVFYFIGFQRPEGSIISPGKSASLEASWGYLTVGFGMIDLRYWWLWGFALLGFFGAALFCLVRAWPHVSQRNRVLALIAFLAAMVSVALGVGYGRAGHGLEKRYCTLAAPFLCGLFFVFVIYGRDTVGRSCQMLLFLIATAMLWRNTEVGITYHEWLDKNVEKFQKDVRSGLPTLVLADRYSRWPFSVYPQKANLARFMIMMHDAGLGTFRELTLDPPYQVIPIDDTIVSRPDPHRFVLKTPRFVYGIRLHYHYEMVPPLHPVAKFSATWKDDRGLNHKPWQMDIRLDPKAQEINDSLLIWTNGPLSEFTVRPDDPPYSCTLWDFGLLVPP